MRLVLRCVAAMVGIVGLPGCSTYRTVWPSAQAGLEVRAPMTFLRCKAIPRVYSGTAYDVCVLFGSADLPEWHGGWTMLAMDLMADTVVLPYTVVQQARLGNLPLRPAATSRIPIAHAGSPPR
jgi:uncharacterized protein YceK